MVDGQALNERIEKLKQEGYKVQVVEEKATLIAPFITNARKAVEQGIFTASTTAEQLDKSTATLTQDTHSTIKDSLRKVQTTAQQYPEAVVIGTATAVIVPALIQRSIFAASRNFLFGSIFVGTMLCPNELKAVASSYMSRLLETLRR
eukprot:c352_g1_i1.p1 GENE.c352_g1_i1~~c352_g1_i1.p1  ORF type:complete len:148 (+),score=24.14 c352_g1_i1:48-491(+)